MKDLLITIALTLTFAMFTTAAAAQSIVFTTLDGDKIDVEAQKDKVVVMAIGATWLPLSNDQASIVNKLFRKYSGRDDIVFYYIATDSESERSRNFASDSDIRDFSRRNKLNVTILRDAEGKQSVKKYNLEELPAFIILDKQGRPDGDPITGIDPFSETDASEIIAKRIDRLL